MQVSVNGEALILQNIGSLADLLAQRGISPDTKGVAVAVNQQIVRKVEWGTYVLSSGDTIEIVTARQGG